MVKASLLVAAVVCLYSSVTLAAKDQSCSLSGDPIQWQAAYCMYREGTDDFAAPAVTGCIDTETRAQHGKELHCSESIHYKLEICKMLIKEGSYKKDSNACLQDKAILPFNVKNGGVDALDG